MSSKHYGISGIGSLIDVGKDGPKLKSTGGVLEARNTADNAYVIFRALSPSGNDDVVTKGYFDTNTAVAYAQFVSVAKSGGDYTTATAALAAITDAAANKKYAIQMYPGVYDEQLTLKDYIDIIGIGPPRAVVITSSTGTVVTASNSNRSDLRNVTVTRTSTSNNENAVVVSAGTHLIYDCVLEQTSTNAAGSLVDISGSSVVQINTGQLTLTQSGTTSGSHESCLIHLQGSGSLYLRGLNATLTVADANDDATAIHEQTAASANIFWQDCDINVVVTNGSYVGTACIYDFSSANTNKFVSASHFSVKNTSGTPGGTGCCYTVDTPAGGGYLKSTANVIEVTGFTNNYWGNVANGDELVSHGDSITAAQGCTGVGTFRVSNNPSNGDHSVSGTLEIGRNAPSGTTNTVGSLKFWSVGDNAYYSSFTAGTQTGNAAYTLPTALPAADSFFKSSSGGVMGWASASDYKLMDASASYGFIPGYIPTLSFSDTTYQVTLTDPGSGWKYDRNGTRCSVTGNKSVRLVADPGGNPAPAANTYYIYIDAVDGTLTSSTSGWTLEDTKVPCAIVMWDDTATPKYHLADELHTSMWPRRLHWEHHFADGAELISGGTISGYTVNEGSPSGDTDNTFGIAETIFADEDKKITNSTLSDPNGTDLAYIYLTRTGASTYGWGQSAVPFKYTTSGYINWNNGGTPTEGQSGKFYCSYLLATNFAGSGRYMCMSGRGEYNSVSEAAAESIGLFNWDGFPVAEAIVLYQFIWATDSSYTTKGKVRLADVPFGAMLSATGLKNQAQEIKIRVLNDLIDVFVPSPAVGSVTTWNGSLWVAGPPVTSSASAGIEWWPDTTDIIAKTTENDFVVETLNKIPVTTTENVEAILCSSNTVVGSAYLYNTALGRTTLEGGAWSFDVWSSVSSTSGGRVSTLTLNMYYVRPYTSPTITVTGSGTSRTVDASSGTPFATTKIDASATNTLASYIQTPKGCYQITARASDTQVTIATPTGYGNESTVAFSVWKKFGGATTNPITALTTNYATTSTSFASSAVTVEATDKLGMIVFGTSNNTTTVNYVYNGSARYSHLSSPLITLHNNLAGLNAVGGNYQHLTDAQLSGLTGGGSTVLHSHAVPTTITVAAEAADQTCYPLFVTAANGDLGPKTHANFGFDALNGWLGVGIAVPTAQLHVTDYFVNNYGNTAYVFAESNVTGNTALYNIGLRGDISGTYVTAGVTDSGYKAAFQALATPTGSYFAGTQTSVMGFMAFTGIGSSCAAGAVVTNAYSGYFVNYNQSASTTLTNSYGVYIDSKNSAVGTITNAWDVYAASGTSFNYFAGSVGIGTTAPTTFIGGTSANIALNIQGTGGSKYIYIQDSNNVGVILCDSSQVADSRMWTFINQQTRFSISTMNDSGSPAEKLSVHRDGTVSIGTIDVDGTPPIGKLIVQGTTDDGSTNIFVGRDSGNANVATLDTNGVFSSYIGAEASDTTCFPLFVTAATGILASKTHASFAFNAATYNLGIGTTSPGSVNGSDFTSTVKLHVKGSGASGFVVIEDSTNAGLLINDSSQAANSRLWGCVVQSTRFSISTYTDVGAPTERFCVLRDGKVGIGTSSPLVQFHVISDTDGSARFYTYNNSNYANVMIGRGRGTEASPTIVTDTTILGAFYFLGYDGSAMRYGAIIKAAVSGTPGANDLPTTLIFGTTADGADSPTEHVALSNYGYFGIGTLGPTCKLDVRASATQASLTTTSIRATSSVVDDGSIVITGLSIDCTPTSVTAGKSNANAVSGMLANCVFEGAGFAGTQVYNFGSRTYAGIGSTAAATGVITNCYGGGFYCQNEKAGSTITNAYGIYINSKNNATGTITNAWDVYAASGTSYNYFAGSVGIGCTAPDAKVRIESATTNALRLSSGTGENYFDMGRQVEADATLGWLKFYGNQASYCGFVFNTKDAGNVLYVHPAGYVTINTSDVDGTPVAGKLTVQGSSLDGSSYVFVGRNSNGTNIATLNTASVLELLGPGDASSTTLLKLTKTSGYGTTSFIQTYTASGFYPYGLEVYDGTSTRLGLYGSANTSHANWAYISSELYVGTTDIDGTPAVGMLTVKGITNNGTTNIFVGRDSDEANQFVVNTDGQVTTGSWHATTVAYDHGGTGLTAYPVKTIILPAASAALGTTTPATRETRELTTNKQVIDVLKFPHSGVGIAWWTFQLPDSYDGGVINAKITYMNIATDGTNNFLFSLFAGCATDGDPLDLTMGTVQELETVVGDTAEDLKIGSWSTGVTPSGTPAGGKLLFIKLQRDPTDTAHDTTSLDAYVLGLRLEYTVNSWTD